MRKIYIFLAGLSILSMSLAGCGGGGGSTEPGGGGGAEPGGGDGGDSTEQPVEPPTHEHTWGIPTYTWSDDYSSCTAERVCWYDSSHKETETVNSTYIVVTEASCSTYGLGRYTASFENSAFLTQTHDVYLEPFGHDYQFDSFVWTDDFEAQAKYICSHDSNHIKYYNAYVSIGGTSSTCYDSGIITYTATYDGHSDTKTEIIPASGHYWEEPTYTWSDDYSSCTAKRECFYDSSHKETETVNSTYAVVTESTEESEGLVRYTATFTKTAFVTQTHDIALDKLDPSYHGETPILSEDSKTLTYGLYPQKNVNNPALVSVLNALTTQESNGWYFYNNGYYAKVSATPYPYDSSKKFDNGTTIISGRTYWFKCEPITWNVLSNTNGEYYILSSVLLDTHFYYDYESAGYNSYEYRTINGEKVYHNNYEYSDIRTWLNNDFYNSAFALGNTHIQTTTVDNSASTTDSDTNKYACNNTQDNIFLPSYQECVSRYNSGESIDCKTTDWARARGAFYSMGSYNLYNGAYWTRSPLSDYSYRAWDIYEGTLWDMSDVGITGGSVRPALTVKIA